MHSFSKDPKQVLLDANTKGYNRVRFQQGKPLLDRELNLLGDLAHPARIAEPYIGSGVPAGSDGFAITNLNVAASEFAIAGGRCLVSGNEVMLVGNTTYKTQPNKGKVVAFPAQPFGVYLHIFPTEFTDVEDADLKNVGDVGFVTALREKTDWEVVTSVAPLTTDHYQLATIDPVAKTVTDVRRKELTVASLRDEISTARGSAATLNNRLNTSLAVDGTIKSNAVGGAQLVNGSVNDTKLTANAVSEPSLANNAVSKRTIQDKAVPISKLSNAVVLDTQILVPASPGAGQLGLAFVNVQTVDEDGFYLISVRQVAPRTQGAPAQSHNLTWVRRVVVSKPFGDPMPYSHSHQIIVQNPNTFAVTVACKAYRITEN